MVNSLIEETLALEPGGIQKGDFIRRPEAEGEDKPEVAGMIISDLASAGYTYIYDTITREPSLCNNNMLSSQLLLKRDNGTPVFTRAKPEVPAWRGTFRCFLHDASVDRKLFNTMGLPVCKKGTLPNQFQADNHARNKHRDEWAAVSAMRESAERAEDREAQKLMMSAIVERRATPAVRSSVPVPTVKEDVQPEVPTGHVILSTEATAKRIYSICSCGVKMWATTEQKLKNKVRSHQGEGA